MIKFSLTGFHCPTPKIIKKISSFVEVVLATVASSVLLTSHPQTAAIMLLVAGLVNKISTLFYEDETTINSSNDTTPV